jgi:hypothetical protein
VAELVGDVDGVAALGDEQAGVGVAKRVGGDVGQAGVLDERGEGPSGVAGAQRCGEGGREDRVAGSAVRGGEATVAEDGREGVDDDDVTAGAGVLEPDALAVAA